MNTLDEDAVLAAIMRYDSSGVLEDLVAAAALVYRVAETDRDLFAVFAVELLDAVSMRQPSLGSADIDKLVELLDFLAPYQESLRAIACLRFRQGRTTEAAALQERSLHAYELNSPGVLRTLANTMDRNRQRRLAGEGTGR
ncbi:MAG: hypothetical protein ACOZQL_42020 [Myxococcota bacterium]